MSENLVKLVKRIRNRENVPPSDVVGLTEDEMEIFIDEFNRPPFIELVDAGTEEEWEKAEAERKEINHENGYDDNGNIVDPLPT